MTSEQFTYWLQGYFEISGSKELNQDQVKVVQEHLALVLTKVTPIPTLSGQIFQGYGSGYVGGAGSGITTFTC